MSIEQQVLRDVHKFMQMFRGLAALANTEWPEIGTLKDEKEAAQAKLDGVNRELAEAGDKLVLAQQGIEDAKVAADEVRAAGEADAKVTRANGDEYLRSKIAEGERGIAAAGVQATDVLTAAYAEARQLRASLVSLQGEIAAAERARDAANAEAAAAQETLADVKRQAEALRTKLG